MWFNPIMRGLLRSPLHFFVSKNMMLMTFTGRKSGKNYTVPMNYFTMNDDGDEFIATTSLKERTWWRNLRGGVPVSIRLQGRDYKGISKVIENEEEVGLIGDVRGLGLMIGIELVRNRKTREPAKKEAARVLNKCFKKGLLMLSCGESVVRIMPPLVITREELDRGLEILSGVLKSLK